MSQDLSNLAAVALQNSSVEQLQAHDPTLAAAAKQLQANDLAPDSDDKRTGVLASEMVDAVFNLRNIKTVALRVGGAQATIAEVPSGEFALLVAGSGYGKSSMAVQVAANVALNHDGWTVFLSAELTAANILARLVGIRTDNTWESVRSGNVTREVIQQGLGDLNRMLVIDQGKATLQALARDVAVMKEKHPGYVGLVVIDYVSIVPVDDPEMRQPDERIRIARTIESIRRLLQKENVAGLVLSQTSRAGANSLNKGELTGVETMATGAETPQLERAAAMTIALSDRAANDNGSTMTINIGKDRYGPGDRVMRVVFEASGRFRLDDKPLDATKVKQEKQANKKATDHRTLVAAIPALVAKSGKPLTREETIELVGRNASASRAAIAECLAIGELVQVASYIKRSSKPMIWTRERATVAGVQIIEPPPSDLRPTSVRDVRDGCDQ